MNAKGRAKGYSPTLKWVASNRIGLQAFDEAMVNTVAFIWGKPVDKVLTDLQRIEEKCTKTHK